MKKITSLLIILFTINSFSQIPDNKSLIADMNSFYSKSKIEKLETMTTEILSGKYGLMDDELKFYALIFPSLLTVIGFSMQDTIVVFDRIRENSNIFRRLDFESLVNHSVVQTLQRSINTQLMTVEFMLLALALFGGVTLRNFAIVMLAGLISGTYSSIFVASAVLVVWEKKEWRTWFRRSSEVSA